MATTLPQDGRASGNDWTEARRAELVNEIASARSSVAEACSRHGLRAEVVQGWLREFRRSAVSAFDERLRKTLVEQGADVALGAAEFAGTLEEISVIDWIQSVELTRKSAVIVVTHGASQTSGSQTSGSQASGFPMAGSQSRVWCTNGAVVDAESGRLRGESALYRIVSFEQGRVLVEFRAERRARTIYASTPSLLLEAAHRKDEAARLWRKLGDPRRTFRVTEKAARRTAYSSQAERRLLEAFQQPSSLLQVVERSELGDVETLTLLTQLSDSQFIAADPSSAPRPGGERDTGDLSASSRTLTTLSVTATPRPALPRWFLPGWAWSGLAALALVTTVALSRFEALSRSEASPGSQGRANAPAGPQSSAPAGPQFSAPAGPQFSAPATAELTPVRAPAEVPTYVVATRFEPPTAAISLDGQAVPSGALNVTFPRDGRAHELRAVAPGYAPGLVVFVDAPPPGVIRLETLPLPAASEPAALAEAAAPGEALIPGNGTPAGGTMPEAVMPETVISEPAISRGAISQGAVPSERSVPVETEMVVLTAKLPRANGRRSQRSSASDATRAPSIRTIHAATPTIRVIP